MGFLDGFFKTSGAIGTVRGAKKLFGELTEKKLPPEYHGNSKAENDDAIKVATGQMSRAQFNRNIQKGKYYAPKKVIPASVYDTYIRKIEKYIEMYPWENHDMDRMKIEWIKGQQRLGNDITNQNVLWKYDSIKLNDEDENKK